MILALWYLQTGESRQQLQQLRQQHHRVCLPISDNDVCTASALAIDLGPRLRWAVHQMFTDMKLRLILGRRQEFQLDGLGCCRWERKLCGCSSGRSGSIQWHGW